MASAGGTWVKSPNFSVSGKFIFVPAQKKGGSATVKKWSGNGYVNEKVTGVQQGGLIAHKSVEAEGWTVTHVGSGLAVGVGFKNQAAALAAMEEMSHLTKWNADENAIIGQDGVMQSVKGIKDKYLFMKAQDAKAKMKTAKELQAEQKGQKFTKPEPKAPAAPKAKQEKVKSEEEVIDEGLNKTFSLMAEKKTLSSGTVVETMDYGPGVTVKKFTNPDANSSNNFIQVSGPEGIKNFSPKQMKEALEHAAGELKSASGITAATASATPKPNTPSGADKFSAEAKTWSTGTKSLDVGDGVTVITKPDGKILVKNTNVPKNEMWSEHKSVDEAMTHAQNIVAGKATAPAASAPTKSTAITKDSFEANKQSIDVTYYGGTKGKAEGVKIEDGHAITLNQNTGKYHLVDEAGKTIGKFDTPEAAHKTFLASKAENMPAPSTGMKSAVQIYGSETKGQEVFSNFFGKEHVGKLTYQEKEALGEYQSTWGCEKINTYLWQKKGNASAEVAYIDSAMKKSPGLPHDTILYRKVSTSKSSGKMWLGLEVGDKYTSHGYDSTSIYEGKWTGNITIQYRAPKGTPGFYMNSKGYSSTHPGEYEYLLPRETSWKVVGKVNTGTEWIFTVEPYGG